MAEEKIVTLLSTDSFTEKLSEQNTLEGIQELFRQEGVELTLEETQNMVTAIAKDYQKSGELSEDDLEEVSGGLLTEVIGILKYGKKMWKWYKAAWNAGRKLGDTFYDFEKWLNNYLKKKR